ncbi:MAG: DNA replication complex subunit Gins51 [Candidatus Heimdallarchaeaceae archaeon]
MFDRIQNKWKEEREKTHLTPMNEAFYGAMRDFLKTRTVRAKEEINPTIKKVLEEKLDRIRYVVNDLLAIRTTKILQAVLNKEEITIILAREEKNFYDRIKILYDVYRKDIFSPKDIVYTDIDSIVGKESIEEEEEEEAIELVAVRFLRSTKEGFQGIDGNPYGPFKEEDVSLLPKENARGLVKREIAENIELVE